MPATFLLVAALLGGLPLLKGALYLNKHQLDAVHLADLVLRMARGELPHLDFMTPIGILAVAPIAAFVRAGAELGHAFLYAQLLVAALLLLPALRVAQSRFAGPWRHLYAAVVMIFCLALVYGEAQPAISVSMHYNRWAWAIAYVILPLALAGPRTGPDRPWLEGAIIGAGLAALLLIKVTYLVALAPAVLVLLLVRRQGTALASAVLAGLLVIAAVTLWTGPAFWLAYLRDLLTLAGSEFRQAPGLDFGSTVTDPAYLGASMALLMAVVLVRQAGRAEAGLGLLLLAPGFFYVTYQNFGNDPQWLFLVALMLLALRPAAGLRNALGWAIAPAMTLTATLAFGFGLPSMLNLAWSPVTILGGSDDSFTPLLGTAAGQGDFLTSIGPAQGVQRKMPYDGPGTPFASFRAGAKHPEPAMLNGEALPECALDGGFVAWFRVVADDLVAAGYGGDRIVTADLFGSFWLYGALEPVKGAAPWYYTGTPGIANADYVLVPLCPLNGMQRARMLKALTEDGWHLDEVRRTPLYILVRPTSERSQG